MATENKNKGKEEKITALYARLSDDDPENEKKGVGSDKESNSIQNQRTILYDYARSHGHLHPQFFYDAAVIIGLKTIRLKKFQKHGAF